MICIDKSHISTNLLLFLFQTEQIQAEYKCLARHCHPDKHPDDPQAGKEGDGKSDWEIEWQTDADRQTDTDRQTSKDKYFCRLLWIDQFHKSQNAPVLYPTMLYSEQKCAHFCSEWGIVGYGTGAFWDFWIWSIVRGHREVIWTEWRQFAFFCLIYRIALKFEI